MKKELIVIFTLVWLICAPIYVSIDYAGSAHIKYKKIDSDAYIWTTTSLGGFYALVAGAYRNEFNGRMTFMFNTWDESLTHLHIDSAEIVVNDTHHKIDFPTQDVAFGHGSYFRDGKMNRNANFSFTLPLQNPKNIPENLNVVISGYVYGKSGLKKTFSYKSPIGKTNKSFITPMYKHLYYQFTIT